ncbi:MAG: hypothetical protein ABI548_14345 [Polyangiaceae bacterium]
MKHRSTGLVIGLAFIAAFIASVMLHSMTAAVIVLLSAVTVAFVLGIAWMRTTTHRVRDKPRSAP